MPEKCLTIKIPEPDEGGRCAYKCLLYDARCGICKGGIGTAGPRGTKPGPVCPQFQGDHHARQATDVNNTRACGR